MRFVSRSTALPVDDCAAATEEAEDFVRAMKAAAQQFKVARPPLCSHATVTNVTTVRPGVVRAKMRFEVTQRAVTDISG